MLDDKRMEKAITYLVNTDQECADKQALADGLKKGFSIVKAIAFTEAEGTVTAREHAAYNSQAYKDHKEKWENALADFLRIKNKRDTECTVIDCWRSINANQRRS